MHMHICDVYVASAGACAWGVPLWLQVCTRTDRTGTGSKYASELGKMACRTVSCCKGWEGEREVPRQARSAKRYTKSEPMRFRGLSARISCKCCHVSFLQKHGSWLVCVRLLSLLHLVIQLRVHLCKCLFTQLAVCFSIEILYTAVTLLTLQGGVTPMGAMSRAATAVKMQSKGQGTFWGSVKRSSSVQGLMSIQQLLVIKRHGQDFAHAQLIDGQWVKGKNSPWSSGQGHV